MTELLDDLTAELLAMPVGPQVTKRPGDESDTFTKSIEVAGNKITATIRGDEGTITDDTATAYLNDEGLDPREWEPVGFKKSTWGGDKESVSFTYKRKGNLSERPPIDELVADLQDYTPVPHRGTGEYGLLILLGDMQFGKGDGDGVDGTVRRTITALNRAADRYASLSEHYEIGHVHIAWLGDHIEGFESQGGANAWRTVLTLNEQIRLTRRTMLHALKTFTPLAERLSMAAVPGNHGEAVRFDGKGVTRYDDSHDTESLIAVADAASLNPEAFGHVEFYVPETDELTVVLDVAGTRVAHAHGHQWRYGKHFDWWKGQAFNTASPMHEADLLVAGHLHHEHVDTDGWRTFIQVPAFESESTWWRHRTGTVGAPGLMVALTKDGLTDHKEVIRGE